MSKKSRRRNKKILSATIAALGGASNSWRIVDRNNAIDVGIQSAKS